MYTATTLKKTFDMIHDDRNVLNCSFGKAKSFGNLCESLTSQGRTGKVVALEIK